MFRALVISMMIVANLKAARTATEGYVDRKVTVERNERVAGDQANRTALTNAISDYDAYVRSEINNISNYTVAVAATNRTDKLWSGSTNYMDGDGVMWKIETTYLCYSSSVSDLVDSRWTYDHGATYPWLNDYYYKTSDLEDYQLKKILFNPDISIIYLTCLGQGNYISMSGIFTSENSGFEVTDEDGGYAYFSYVPVTNAINRSVTTNGTVIIIGQSADDSGTVTQQVAKAGSETVTMDFLGRAEVDAKIDAIPTIPTNFVSGINLYDAGSNIVTTLIMSNGILSVWEVIND